ncbi:MAG: hypothetical protein ACP5Q0_04270 [Halothiobacillus sp.]
MKLHLTFIRRSRWPARSALFLLLLAALWGYVIPYQAGVRLDKALAAWVAANPDWQLIRLTQSPYQRDFTLVRHGFAGTPALAARLTLHTLPPGWPTASGNQWGWARFKLKITQDCPVQIYPLPRVPNDEPLSLDGFVNWQGHVLFTLADAPNTGELRFDAARDTWHGTIDTPGFVIHWDKADYLFGRTRVTAHTQLAASNGLIDLSQAVGEIDLDIRQLGWVTANQRGRVDQFQLRLSQAKMNQGAARAMSVFCAARSVSVNQKLWGGGQLAINIGGAEPSFLKNLATLITDVRSALMLMPAQAAPPDEQAPTEPLRQQLLPRLAQLVRTLPQDTLPAVLVALRAADVHLSALYWHNLAGQIELAGEALGPRYKTAASQAPAIDPIPPPLTWQLHATLRQARTQSASQDLPMNISYGAEGWQINGQSVDSSAIFP